MLMPALEMILDIRSSAPTLFSVSTKMTDESWISSAPILSRAFSAFARSSTIRVNVALWRAPLAEYPVPARIFTFSTARAAPILAVNPTLSTNVAVISFSVFAVNFGPAVFTNETGPDDEFATIFIFFAFFFFATIAMVFKSPFKFSDITLAKRVLQISSYWQENSEQKAHGSLKHKTT